MGIFAQFARKYWESGIQPVPVEPGSKICRIKDSNKKFFEKFLTEKELEKWEESHGHWDIGMACGAVSKVVCVDFDYEGYPDSPLIEAMVKGSIPHSPLVKRGKKGWTAFYRYNPDVRIRHFRRGDHACVDVLSSGAITVLPPTQHSDGVFYQWLGEELIGFNINDLPELCSFHLTDLEAVCGFDIKTLDHAGITGPRHTRLFQFTMVESDRASSMSELIERVIAYDVNVIGKSDPKGAYSKDPKYASRPLAKEVERFVDWKRNRRKETGVVWDVGQFSKVFQSKRPSQKYEDFKAFFEFHFPTARKCKIRNEVYFKDKHGAWKPILNNVEMIRSKCVAANLSPGYVNMHMHQWIYELPPRLLIDIGIWTPTHPDHIGYWCDQIEVLGIDHSFFKELIKEWMANMILRIDDSSHQNRMLILRGDQGIGKDWATKFLLGGLDLYFNEICLSENKKDNYHAVSSLLVGRIPEFDETDKISIAVIKSLITAESSLQRFAYKATVEDIHMHCSFVSNTNFDNVLRDSSGNRRFLLFTLKSITHGFPELDQPGILAQARYLADTRYQASKIAHRAMKELLDKETPTDPEFLFMDEVRALFARQMTYREYREQDYPHYYKYGGIAWAIFSRHVHEVGRRYNYSTRRVSAILKRYGMMRKYEEGQYLVPLQHGGK